MPIRSRTVHARKATAAAVALSLLCTVMPSRADLNSEVNDMFNNLGAIGNYTAPGRFAARPTTPTPAAT